MIVSIIYNQQVYKTVAFNSGDQVRILEKQENFDKWKQKFSKALYTTDKKKNIN
jgi:hypothetical protein